MKKLLERVECPKIGVLPLHTAVSRRQHLRSAGCCQNVKIVPEMTYNV